MVTIVLNCWQEKKCPNDTRMTTTGNMTSDRCILV
jgi:hypothetical protein